MTIWERIKREIIKALDSYQKRKAPAIQLPRPTPTPQGDKPATGSCGCDLSKGWGHPLVPKHGANDAAVDANLRHRWLAVKDGGLGLQDSCGGLPNDVRPLLVRLTRGTFGWKHMLLDKNYPNRPRIEFDGKGNMRAFCGDYEDERYHPVGKSDKEWDGGNIPKDFEEIEPGVWTPQKHFVSFRKVNQ